MFVEKYLVNMLDLASNKKCMCQQKVTKDKYMIDLVPSFYYNFF